MRIFLILLVCNLAAPSTAKDLAEMANVLHTGQWGWVEGRNTCSKNPHEIRFTQDLSEMIISWDKIHDPASYSILYADTNSFTSIIQGEKRKTKLGDLVIWQLKMRNTSTYCWRRTDWPADACTPDVVQCVGNS